jgi:cysteine desulfurase family protein (TIGR01976 family)
MARFAHRRRTVRSCHDASFRRSGEPCVRRHGEGGAATTNDKENSMLDVAAIRTHFPALASDTVYLDNPGGTQIAREALARLTDHAVRANANSGGAFATSQAADAIVVQARRALADFLGAAAPEEIVFGLNMTTLTLHVSRSLAHELQPGDEIVVTRLDHDANIAPWLLVARDRGCTVRWVDFDVEDCTLDLADLARRITPRTKLVAVGYASNAVGTVNDVRRAVELAHAAGALCYVDAVHYAPHGPIDVQALGCDFLVCSAYKFYGPHLGVLYGRRELLERLPAYKVRPASDAAPERWETGTQSFEAIAGVLGALEYLAWLGTSAVAAAGTTAGAGYGAGDSAGYGAGDGAGDAPGADAADPGFSGRRGALRRAMAALRADERERLTLPLLRGLAAIPGLHIHGISDPDRLDERVATVSFTLDGWHPRAVAAALAEKGINVWDGNYYALAVTERLGLEAQGGMVRVGPVHYNTTEEVARVVEAVAALAEARAPG